MSNRPLPDSMMVDFSGTAVPHYPPSRTSAVHVIGPGARADLLERGKSERLFVARRPALPGRVHGVVHLHISLEVCMKLPVSPRAVSATALLLLAAAVPLAAQPTGRVTGRVTDAATNRPIQGVQVFIPPTGIGTLTDAAGRFLLLNVPPGTYPVTAQLVGYRQGTAEATVTAGEVQTVEIRLQQTAIDLAQIVVTGAGVATERRKLGNTIATIDAGPLENAPISDFSQILQGRVPGVASLPSSGFTGEGARIRIRGSSSLSQLNEPIVYVDGIRVDRSAMTRSTGGQASVSRLDDIPPDAIERIEILKGAAAATLYGTEASNGVIQIFTKRGRTGAPQFTFQTEFTGITVPTNRIEPLADYPRTQTDVNRMNARWGTNLQPFEVFQQDLFPGYFERGFGQVYSGSVSGGGGLITYYVSGRYQHEDGPLGFHQAFDPVPGIDPAKDENRRIQTTANLTVTPHDRVRIRVSSMYSETDHESPETSNNIYGLFSSALMSQLRLACNEVDPPTCATRNQMGAPAFATTNETMYQVNTDNAKHFAGSLNLNYTPTDPITLDGTIGVDFVSASAFFFRPFRWAIDHYSTATPEGTRGITETRNHIVTADVKAAWETRPSADISNTLLAGTQGFLAQRTNKGGTGTRFPGPGLEVAGAGADQSIAESWVRNVQVGGYLQDQIGWRDWAFLTVGGRWDANSAFGEQFNTAFYPKASLSVMPTEALGWYSPVFSTLRVRGAIGRSGLQPSAFDKFTTFSPLPSSEGPGVSPSNLGNDALRPEVSTEWELGSELGLINDRFSVDFTYWNRQVTDAIVNRQFAPSGGFISTQADNIGRLEAWGTELVARGSVHQSRNVSISVFGTASFLRETIVDMGGAPPQKTGGSYSRYRNFLVEGYAPGAFFGAEVARHLAIPLNIDGSCTEPTRAAALAYFSEPRNPSAFKPLVIGNAPTADRSDGFNTQTGLASHNCGEGFLLTYLGKPQPDWSGGFGFNVGFLGHFDVNTLFEYKARNFSAHDLSGEFRRAHNGIGRNIPRAAELAAIMENPASTAEQRLEAALEWVDKYEGLAPLDGINSIKPADFIRWREVSLAYRVPGQFIERFGLNSATISVAARNLMLWVNSQYPGMDPEVNVLGRCNGGLDCNFLDSTEGWGLPVPRRFTVATRVTF
jgi:TonB-dependent starch-binding outer membrane protein SusC